MSKEKIKSEKSKRSIGKRAQHIKVEKMIEKERKDEEFMNNRASDQLLSMINKLEKAVEIKKEEYRKLQETASESETKDIQISVPRNEDNGSGETESEVISVNTDNNGGNTGGVKELNQSEPDHEKLSEEIRNEVSEEIKEAETEESVIDDSAENNDVSLKEICEESDMAVNQESSDPEPSVSDKDSFYEAEEDEVIDCRSDDKPLSQQPETLHEILPGSYSEKRSSSIKSFILAGVILALLIAFFQGGYFLLSGRGSAPTPDEKKEDSTPEDAIRTMPEELRNTWLINKQINSDYIGNIVFDSGLIDLPVVQAKGVYKQNGDLYAFYTEEGQLVEDPEGYTGNDVYIWKNWKTGEYDSNGEGGSVFMDFRNNLNDQNIIIYGHHFARDYDPSGDKLFTPLDLLLEEKNYEANKSLKLILDNEIREYVVTDVFIVNIDNEYELNFMRRNMDEDLSGNPDPGFFKDYIKYVGKVDKYPINESLNESDNMLTLVTCIQHQPQYRELILCKEIKRIVYE